MRNRNIQNQAYPLTLFFGNLSYNVKISHKLDWFSIFSCTNKSNLSSKETEMKVLLNDVSGEAHRGEILAVLGPSGSGKSTLIDALANRIFKGSLNGMITLSGEQLDSSLLRAISAYIMQDHLLFPMLTVEETLTFAAELRLLQILSKFEKKKRVHDLIDQLDHQTAAQTIIGDEEHWGVWWRTPAIYSGSPSNLPFFVENLGQPIPTDQNPSDAILDLICDLEYSRDGIDSMAQFNQIWQQQYMGGGKGSEVKQFIAKQSLNLKQAFSQSLDLKQAFSSIISQDKLVPGTTHKDDFKVFTCRFGATLITGIITASLFWQLDNSPRGYQERVTFFAFVTIAVYYICSDGLAITLQERNIMLRETTYNVYRLYSYWLSVSDALTWLPSLLLLSITYSVTTFWAPGLLPDTSCAYMIIVKTLGSLVLFCEVYVTPNEIPLYWIPFHYLSLKKYTYQALMHNEFDDPTRCIVIGIEVFNGTPFVGTELVGLKEQLLRGISHVLGKNIMSWTCTTTGPDLLKQRGMADIGK
ncbi:ABC transporter G family member 16-like [Coffea arabica]|uniref:ABC transporter G family member 16-like n=1 Tax=Coffea arabica TaxID=13443 RepID=A0A6P6SNW0_COFAR|nr:ABC transporter G family member 20-like [Coffea arabica]